MPKPHMVQPTQFQLHDGLAQTEAGKDTAATPAQRPQDAHALVIFQHRADLGGVNLDARQGRNVDFAL